MSAQADPRIDRLETLASRVSRMHHAAMAVFRRQRGNLTRDDRALIALYLAEHQAFLTLLWAERQGTPPAAPIVLDDIDEFNVGPPGRK